MEKNYDFSGWATKNNLKCSDGRTIMRDAFKDCDGKKVPLVWNHNHSEVSCVLGHALLKNMDEGVYAYCSFNETESGKDAKLVVEHGDIVALSIYANQLQEDHGGFVRHGVIREVSLVHAGANPGAFIDSTIIHSDGSVEENRSQGVIYTGENFVLAHADPEEEKPEKPEEQADEGPAESEQKPEEEIAHSDKEDDKKDEKGETLFDIIDTMTEKQKNAMYAIVGSVVSDKGEKKEEKESKEDPTMSHNIFDQDRKNSGKTLSHADGVKIVELAKSNGGNSLRAAMELYCEDNQKELKHANDDLGFKDIDQLFPEYDLRNGGAPEQLGHDTSWVAQVMRKVSKSPKNRLRVRFADVRDITGRRAQGYTKGTQKQFMGNISLLGRTVDPTTVYNLDKLNRDDILDITDFNLVEYMYRSQRANLEEELARAILIGDGRNGSVDEGQEIDKTKIIPIWDDDDLFTIHKVIDIQGMRETMNGSDSSRYFGDNYVYSEAVIQSMLYAREEYKGSGGLDFYCTPHLVNVMLLARDMNGRRIYDNVNDLKASMNVNDIVTVEQFEGKTREVVVDGSTQVRRLLGIMVNLKDYVVGSTNGSQITHFTDFDIRFNQNLSLLETRLCGMLERPFSAIVLEEVLN